MPTPPAQPNKRRVRRRQPRPRASITCYKGSFGLGKNLVESVVDLSEAGFSLLTTEPLQVGQVVEVYLGGPAEG